MWCLSTGLIYVVSQHRAVSSVSAHCRSVPGVSAPICMLVVSQHRSVCDGVSAWVCIWCLSTSLYVMSQHEFVSVVITSLRDVMTAIKPAVAWTCHSVSCACAQSAKIHDHSLYRLRTLYQDINSIQFCVLLLYVIKCTSFIALEQVLPCQ